MADLTITPADFMAGVAWACAFMRRADALNGTGRQHCQAMYRSGQPQAGLLPELVAIATSRPELVPGINAILVEYLCCGGPHGAGIMNIDAYEALTLEDFTREECPDEPSNVVQMRRVAHHG